MIGFGDVRNFIRYEAICTDVKNLFCLKIVCICVRDQTFKFLGIKDVTFSESKRASRLAFLSFINSQAKNYMLPP